MYYNLFGDYVKGSDLSRFPDKVQKGLWLHREIDDYIDHHPKVLELLHNLYPELPKISGIAVDLYFDHLLAKYWSDYHPVDLDEYLNKFYQTVPSHSDWFTDDFKFVLSKMIKGKWINKYGEFEGLKLTCERLSARIPFKNDLFKAPAVYHDMQKEIELTFRQYMTEAKEHFDI